MQEQVYEQLTLFPEDSRASRFPVPGSSEARMMTVTSGRKCSELYGNFGPLGCLVRMCLESSIWHSTRCLLTWKRKDTKSRRSLFQLAVSTPRTEETESLFWPTVRSHEVGDYQYDRGDHSKKRLTLTGATKMWPTPTSRDWKDGTAKSCANVPVNDLLGRAVHHPEFYPTPRAQSATGPSNAPNRQGGQDLQSVAGGKLNPNWVEWLMGYPIGYTEVD